MKEKKADRQAVISIYLITLLFMTTGCVFPSLKVGVSNWAMCHWGITYEAGFVYRGLIGTICTSIFGMMTEKKIYFLTLVLLVVLYFIFVFIFTKLYKKEKNILVFLLILFIISQPSNVRWWSVDEMFSRLDIIIFILALLCCIIIVSVKRTNLMLVLILVISVAALMVHEGYGIHFTSILFALAMYKTNINSEKINLKPLFFYYIPILLIFGLISVLGSKDTDPAKLSAVFEKNVSADFSYSMPVVVRRVITDSFSKKVSEVKNLRTWRVFLSLSLTYLVMLPSLIMFIGMFIKSLKALETKRKKILLILSLGASFAPLAASFIAYDQFRWIGFFIITLSMCLVTLCFIDKTIFNEALLFIKKYKYYFIFAITMAIIFGVLHDMYGFGYIETIILRMYY